MREVLSVVTTAMAPQVVKYWPAKNSTGFVVWKYLLRRDDPVSCVRVWLGCGPVRRQLIHTPFPQAPAPWTAEGKRQIKKLGLTMQVCGKDGVHSVVGNKCEYKCMWCVMSFSALLAWVAVS